MLLGGQKTPRNPRAIKELKKQMTELVERAEDYRDFKFYHLFDVTSGKPGDNITFCMDIDIAETGEDIDTFEFWFVPEPDRDFLARTKGLFTYFEDKTENGTFWKIFLTKAQFSNDQLVDELLVHLFGDWPRIELLFESDEALEEFESHYEVILPYRFHGEFEEDHLPNKLRGAGTAAAAGTTGYFVAYQYEEEVTYAEEDDSSGFEFPEF
jgi:hypothetical protein